MKLVEKDAACLSDKRVPENRVRERVCKEFVTEFVYLTQGIKLVEKDAACLFDDRVAEDSVRERVCIEFVTEFVYNIRRASNRWRRTPRVYKIRELQRIEFVRECVCVWIS